MYTYRPAKNTRKWAVRYFSFFLPTKLSRTLFEAYLENKTPSAGRVFWAYGPDPNDITVLGVEPHPDDKKGAYAGIKLSMLPAASGKKT